MKAPLLLAALTLLPALASAHPSPQCPFTAQLSCQAVYIGKQPGGSTRINVESVRKEAPMAYVDTGEPSIDECYAQNSFNENDVYLSAILDERSTLFVYGSRREPHREQRASLAKGEVIIYRYDFTTPYERDDGKIVDGAVLTCVLK